MELVSHVFPVNTRQSDEILLMPVGDIQWYGDDRAVALGMLKRHIQWGVDKGAYFLGMGDYIDAFSPSNRAEFRAARIYDSAIRAVDDKAKQLVDQLYEEALAPSKGRWLGLLEGHHFHEFRDGTTTDQYLADKLDTKFLGTSGYVRLLFRRSNGSAGTVLIWCHHGNGGGARVSSPLNKLDQLLVNWEADIYLVGHMHKKVAAPIDRNEPVFPVNGGTPRIVHRTKIIACTGSFLKGYIAGNTHGRVPRGNYPEQKMLPPVSLGGVLVKIRPRWTKKEGGDLFVPDLNVEL